MAFEKIDKRTFFTSSKPTNSPAIATQLLSENELDQLLLRSIDNSIEK